MSAKPWQIAVIVLGLAIGVGSVAYSMFTGENPHIASTIYLVDVETGDLYRGDLDKQAFGLPARNPVTRRVCLVRISQDKATGKWVVTKHDRTLLSQLDKGVENKAVDPDTGELLQPPKTPVDYVPPKRGQ